ncbi:efflux RND transporter periplasmic adaptor subunit [Paenibacillus sp. CF384]|uniref:efflux RND transporter periplasmic adaptor subunit n=1 Tax=Paenibacillus sp. CF384 TaxID=1884382 RepID=UPI000899617E|nr:hypothetical protein [Paenibacillus sp. CF384]SDW15411.1 Multidrug efflux pump subunit AcrA (membrane-fusion protein) [Paenibacillus sp. CF384]
MDATAESTTAGRRKRAIGLIAGIGGASLVLLTLFSNTLYGLTLPKVTTEQPADDGIDPVFKGTGVVHYALKLELSNPGGGNVKEVLVKEGDKVTRGQGLVRYENDEAMQQIEAGQAALDKLELALPALRRIYIEAARESDAEVLEDARIALESANIDIASQEKNIRALQHQAEERGELRAPFDGVIIAVHAIAGLPSGVEAAPDIQLADLGKGLQIETQVPRYLTQSHQIGDPIAMSVGESGRDVQGELVDIGASSFADSRGAEVPEPGDAVTPVDDAPPTIRVLIGITDTKFRDGEQITFKLTTDHKVDGVMVSSTAVHYGMDGAYVFVVDRREGPLGNAAYARKVPVTVSAINGPRTAVAEGLLGDETVILDSSEPLADGVQIRP